MSADARAKALSALARSQVTETAVGDTRHRIAETTLEAIRPAVVAGVTMLGADGHLTTAVYTDPLSPEIDEAQYREGIGPVPRRLAGKAIVRIGHMDAARDHYPGFAAACLPHRMLSIPSMPILGGGVSIGALNLYAHGAEAFDDEAESVASDLAGAAGSVFANVSACQSAVELSENLNQAMRSPAVIEQAKRILMAQSPELTADDAFDLVRRASQRENVKLRDIAQRIVDRRPQTGTRRKNPRS